MAVDTSVIGKPTSKAKVVVDRAPVSNFAAALTETNPVYTDPKAAKAAGLDNIPAPLTWPFAMEFWGKYPEIQGEQVKENPMFKIMGQLRESGGLILHGEQEFIYHRPIVVGDELEGEGVIKDIYEKESKGRTMTFIVTETVWKDAKNGEPVVTALFNLIHRS